MFGLKAIVTHHGHGGVLRARDPVLATNDLDALANE